MIISARRGLTTQKGVTLVVALIVLSILTFTTVSIVNISNVDLKVASNVQSKQVLQNHVSQAMEVGISSVDTFLNPVEQEITVGYSTVEIPSFECLRAVPASGYSAVATIIPEETHWHVQATSYDEVTSARVTLHQGVRIKLLSGACD